MRLVMASANPNKAAEIARLLTEYDIEPRPPELGDILESEQTLEGNARVKAAAVCRQANAAAVADDTGLEVDALGGMPGVWSARYAGEHATDAANLSKLLEKILSSRMSFVQQKNKTILQNVNYKITSFFFCM